MRYVSLALVAVLLFMAGYLTGHHAYPGNRFWESHQGLSANMGECLDSLEDMRALIRTSAFNLKEGKYTLVKQALQDAYDDSCPPEKRDF